MLMLSSHFRLRKLRSSYQGENVAIYALSSGKIPDVRKVAGVKDLTNIMDGKSKVTLFGKTCDYSTPNIQSKYSHRKKQ